jgi:N-glycosylase/DNA lyase
MWSLDIPVDTHIHRLTEELTNTEMNNDDVRAWWGVIGERADIARHIVAGALWHIGNKWDEWGEEYWNEVTE